jgi:hypothetical protein
LSDWLGILKLLKDAGPYFVGLMAIVLILLGIIYKLVTVVTGGLTENTRIVSRAVALIETIAFGRKRDGE